MSIKNFLNKFLSPLNIKLVNKKFSGNVDKRDLSPFQNDNKYLKLYYEGLEKSKNEHTDNFFKQSRFLDLVHLSISILKKDQTYDFAECGCWTGHSSYVISKLIQKYNKNIKFHIFDSFEGLSSNIQKDSGLSNLNKNQLQKMKTQFTSNENFVKSEVLKDFDFIKIYKGWIPNKFHLVEEQKFSFVHIDVDLYEPTLKSLEFFYPKLVDGGIIVCDDYNFKHFNGSKKAWDEFFSDKKVKINFAPSMGGGFIVK